MLVPAWRDVWRSVVMLRYDVRGGGVCNVEEGVPDVERRREAAVLLPGKSDERTR